MSAAINLPEARECAEREACPETLLLSSFTWLQQMHPRLSALQAKPTAIVI